MEGGKETGEKPGDQTGSGHRVDPGPDEKHHLPRPTGQAEAARHSSGRGESALRSALRSESKAIFVGLAGGSQSALEVRRGDRVI